MNDILEKYEAKLSYIEQELNRTKHLMDEDTLDMMNDLKLLLTEVVFDIKMITIEANSK